MVSKEHVEKQFGREVLDEVLGKLVEVVLTTVMSELFIKRSAGRVEENVFGSFYLFEDQISIRSVVFVRMVSQGQLYINYIYSFIYLILILIVVINVDCGY